MHYYVLSHLKAYLATFCVFRFILFLYFCGGLGGGGGGGGGWQSTLFQISSKCTQTRLYPSIASNVGQPITIGLYQNESTPVCQAVRELTLIVINSLGYVFMHQAKLKPIKSTGQCCNQNTFVNIVAYKINLYFYF